MKPEDLDEAVERLKEALDKYPNGHTDIPSASSLLCGVFTTRYVTFKRYEDILDAIGHGEKAISIRTPDDHYAPIFFGNLAQAYRNKWAESRADEDLAAAIKNSAKCIQMTPNNIPYRAYPLLIHGSLLMARVFTHDTRISHRDLNEPLCYLKKAAELPNGVALVRITAARNAIRILRELGDWEDAKALGLTAMKLLPLVCGRYLALRDQQQAISETSGLAADVCSLFLQMQEPEKALLQLEAGRAILLGYVMDDRADLVSLYKECPDLAQKFEDLRSKLRIPPDLQDSSLGEVKLRERRAAEVAIYQCLDEIREIEGHKDFLRGLSVDEMRACSKEGPVVIVNVTFIRSDAILIVGSKIRVVPLLNLQLEKAAEFSSGSYARDSSWERDVKLISSTIPKQTSKETFVEWLWHSCVKVVFKELKTFDVMPENGELPRVWWIGSGAATGFPFHAAASGSGTDQDALSHMIPSYTPSIKALLHSRQRSRRSHGHNPKYKLTVVTMKITPGHDTLPGVSREKEVILKVCSGVYKCMELQQPDVNAVLKALADSDIIHFACHGMANIEDPSQSHLLLEKVTKNGREVDKLTVSHMLSLESPRQAWISYLSACSTAGIRAPRLADEGLHTSGAFQIAGFAHVIGSMWPVDDDVCVDVARVFYERLITAQGEAPQDRRVAEALREAVVYIRQRDPSSWKKWGAYIHSGA